MAVLSLLRMGPHGKRMCHTFKLLKGESFNVPSPQNPKNQKEQESQQTQPKQTLITLKAIKEEYNNPDLIAQLSGKAYETHILVDYVKCLALIDSGAQISTITIELIKQLGLKIHQLDRILKSETTGGGSIPYMGYVETNLKIPEIKELMKTYLCM